MLSEADLAPSTPDAELPALLAAAHEELKQTTQQKIPTAAVKAAARALVDPRLTLDADVRLLTACCLADVLRVCAPSNQPPYGEEELKAVFAVIAAALRGLGRAEEDAGFGHARYVLERLVNVMAFGPLVEAAGADPDCELVEELLRTLFAHVGETTEAAVRRAVEMCVLEAQELSQPVLDVLLAPLLAPRGPETRVALRVATDVLRATAAHVEAPISRFLNGVLVGGSRGAASGDDSELAESVHMLVYQLHKVQPSLLLHVLPNVCLQLRVDDLSVRTAAASLLGRLFASEAADYGSQYAKLFAEFLDRFRDVDKSVRVAMVQLGTLVMTHKPALAAAVEPHLLARFMDAEADVRVAAVNEVCNAASNAIDLVSEPLMRAVGERVKDKKERVRLDAMTGLAQIYAKHLVLPTFGSSDEPATLRDPKLDWVPGFVLRCFAFPEPAVRRRVLLLLDDIMVPKTLPVPARAAALRALVETLDEGALKALRVVLRQRAARAQQAAACAAAAAAARKNSSKSQSQSREALLDAVRALLEASGAPALSSAELTALTRVREVTKALGVLGDPASEYAQVREARSALSKHAAGKALVLVARQAANALMPADAVAALVAGMERAGADGDGERVRADAALLRIFAEADPRLLRPNHTVAALAAVAAADERPRGRARTAALELLACAPAGACDAAEAPLALVQDLQRQAARGDRARLAVGALRALGVAAADVSEALDAEAEAEDDDDAAGLVGAAAAWAAFGAGMGDAAGALERALPVLAADAGDSAPTAWAAAAELAATALLLPGGWDAAAAEQVLAACFAALGRYAAQSARVRAAAAQAVLTLARAPQLALSPRRWHALAWTAHDPDADVRLQLLRGLKQAGLKLRYVAILALFAVDPDAELRAEAKAALLAAVRHLRQAASAQQPQLLPEFMLPYAIHLLAHHPSAHGLDLDAPAAKRALAAYLGFAFDALVYSRGTQADNMAFVLQLLDRIAECDDALGRTDAVHAIAARAAAQLRGKIRSQANLKPYAGELFVPGVLFVSPGSSSSVDVDEELVERRFGHSGFRSPPRASPTRRRRSGASPARRRSSAASPGPAASPTRVLPSRKARPQDSSLIDSGSESGSSSSEEEEVVSRRRAPARRSSRPSGGVGQSSVSSAPASSDAEEEEEEPKAKRGRRASSRLSGGSASAESEGEEEPPKPKRGRRASSRLSGGSEAEQEEEQPKAKPKRGLSKPRAGARKSARRGKGASPPSGPADKENAGNLPMGAPEAAKALPRQRRRRTRQSS